MAGCLGLYIEDNVIKYAKISRDRDNLKVEAFGLKFYDNVEETIKQIISETYSFKTPISINLSGEKYTYAELFNLLNAKDINKAASTEFEYFCNENHKNRNALDYRNLLVPNLTDKDKITSLYAYTEKSDIVGKLQMLSGFSVSNISPISVTISNLINSANKKNKLILNIEMNTSATFIINGQVEKVEIMDIGMEEIFNNIITRENSYAKAYEICKNTTIYTTQGRNLQVEENEYIEDIMPTLYKIVERVKEIIAQNKISVDELYITGLAAAINNIDLYFQENFLEMKCEILAPFFVQKSNIKLNIMDYIEVNSAISLALQGLGIGYKEMNFKKVSLKEKLSQALTIEVGGSSKNKNGKNNANSVSMDKLKNLFKLDFNTPLDIIEKNMIRCAAGIFILILAYGGVSAFALSKINEKDTEVNEYIAETNAQIAVMTNNYRLISERTQQYSSMIQKIDEANDKITQSYAKKNVLPNFLTEIMFNIPKEVQLLSIQNGSGKKISIEAQSREYEQLGYFIAKIRNEAILTDVTATSGIRQGEFILVTIEGNLPY